MAKVNKISSFKSFTEIRKQESVSKLREENNLKRQESVGKIAAILDELGLTSFEGLEEDQKESIISKIFGDVSEEEIAEIEVEVEEVSASEEVTESDEPKCTNRKGHLYKQIDKDGTVECVHCGLRNSLSESVVIEESVVTEESVNEAVNSKAYVNAGKLGYNDQFLGRRSLSWTLSVDLGLKASDEFVGPWLGFDHVSLYAIGKKGGTIIDDALTGKYTYDELKAAAADFLGIKESKEVNEAKKIAKSSIEEIGDFRDSEGWSSNEYYILADWAQEEFGDGPYDIKKLEKLVKTKKVQKDLEGQQEIDFEHLEELSDSLIKDVENTKVVTESGEEAGLPAEDLKDETEVVDTDCETPEDKSKELEAELEDTVDAAGNEEISEAEETETVEETEEEEEEVRLVSDMLKEVYESCKNEAKAWEDDAHDEHTVETYMKENAALVGALAAQSLKEMKEEYSVEAYEAACNEMIEAYSKKVNEMKESDSAVGEETPEA